MRKICVLLLLFSFALGLSVSCDNSQKVISQAQQGSVVLTLKNQLAGLGEDSSVIEAKSFFVEVYQNSTKVDEFSVDVASRSKFVTADDSASVTRSYQAGQYTAVVYARNSEGKNLGKGSLDFLITGGATTVETAHVIYRLNTLEDFSSPSDCPVMENGVSKGTLSMTNTITQPLVKYVELKKFFNLMMKIVYEVNEEIYSDSLNADGTVYRVTNDRTKAYLEVNTNDETLYFSDYDAFFLRSTDVPLVSAVMPDTSMKTIKRYDISGNPRTIPYSYYLVDDTSSSYDASTPVYSLDLTPWKKEDGTIGCYIPLNIAKDLHMNFQRLNYNGKNIVWTGTSDYYNDDLNNTDIPQPLAEFNLIDFCFNMDLNYGLAEEHGITNGFLAWLTNLDGGSVYRKLLSTKSADHNQAYLELVYRYFGDLHSSFTASSFYDDFVPPDVQEFAAKQPENCATGLLHFVSAIDSITDARKKELTTDVKVSIFTIPDFEGLSLYGRVKGTEDYKKIEVEYTEDGKLSVGNIADYEGVTLFVTFNEFTYYASNDTYIKNNTPYSAAQLNHIIHNFGQYGSNYNIPGRDSFDTRTLAKAANILVRDYDALASSSGAAGITNLVVDLACNIGGTADSGIFFGSWLMGQSDHCIVNSVTGAKSETSYVADVNGDGLFGAFDKPDLRDSVTDKKIYALTSRVTFSCANMLACQLKATGKVTTLGSATAGGACVVLPLTTVDGTVLNVSSNMRLSLEKNGSFTSVDNGVEPDYRFASWEDYADRFYITKVINTL